MLFLSGAAALVYEIAWQRQLVLVVGGTAQAIACVLSFFMTGLSIGSYAAGRFCDRTVHHIRYYARCEGLIALTGVGAGLCFAAFPNLFAQLQLQGCSVAGWQKLLLSGLAMLPSAVLMGASLPLAVRGLSLTEVDKQKQFSDLYGANLLGGAIGVLVACFVGFSYLGIIGTVMCAGLANLVVCAVAWGLPNKTAVPVLSEEAASATPWFLVTVAVLSGYCAMAFEVLWTRFLRYYTTSTTYAFAMMLAVFLLGLFVASVLQKKEASNGQLGKYFVWTFFSVLLSFAFLPAAELLADTVRVLLSLFLPPQAAGIAASLAVAVVFLLPSAVCCGLIFPALGNLANSSRNPGRAIGSIYAANTVGCIAGSAVTLLVLVPLFGSQLSLWWCLVLTAMSAILCYRRAGLSGLKYSLLLALLAIGLIALRFGLPDSYLDLMRAAGMRGQLMAAGEDSSSSVSVLGFPGFKKMMINGEPYSSTALHGQRYMRLIGHFPCLVHPNPKRVLSVCYGTGTTAGASAVHPDVKSVDIVELSPAVLSASPLFSDVNRDVLASAKTNVYVDDARNYLQSPHSCWDVITFEPPPPYDAGVTNLYTVEFYRQVKGHLCSQGIMCQWVPMGLQSEALWKMMLASAAQCFQYVSVWCPNNREAILLASDTAPRFDAAAMRDRMQPEQVGQSLAEVGFDSPEAILSTLLLTNEQVRDYTRGSGVLTDDKPALEFFLAYPFKLLYPADLEERYPIVSSTTDDEALVGHRHAIYLLRQAGVLVDRHGDFSKAREALEKANKLVPGNRFLEWAKEFVAIQG